MTNATQPSKGCISIKNTGKAVWRIYEIYEIYTKVIVFEDFAPYLFQSKYLTVLIRGDASHEFWNIAISKIKSKTQSIPSDKQKIIILETLEL